MRDLFVSWCREAGLALSGDACGTTATRLAPEHRDPELQACDQRFNGTLPDPLLQNPCAPSVDVSNDSAERILTAQGFCIVAEGYRIWLRNSLVRGSCAFLKKVFGGPYSTITPRSVK